MNRLLRRQRYVVVAVALVPATASFVLSGASAHGSPGSVVRGPGTHITWRAHHIPRITARSLRGVGWGEGYAQAGDGICTLADRFVTDNGERSRYFGPNAGYLDQPIGGRYGNLESDWFYQRLKVERTVEHLLARRSPIGPTRQARQLARGYAAGYNAYLAHVGVNRLPDRRCRGARWVKPITEATVWRHVFDTLLLASSRALLEQMVTAKPPAPELRRSRSSVAPLSGLERAGIPATLRPQIGSNAVAIGAKGTRNHRGLLLANPHFPWRGSERFYQARLTIPHRLDVAGVSLLGHPLIEIGHTAGMAWSHTVNGSFRFAVYELSLVPGDPRAYLYNGHIEHLHPERVTVRVRTGGHRLERRSHTFWLSRYGPIVNVQPPALGWNSGKAYAIRDLNATNLRLLDQFLAIDRAQSVAQLQTALVRWQGIPWVNTIAADSQGNAFYADISITPHISDQQIKSCVTAPVGTVALKAARLPVLDGSRPQCALGKDPDAIQPGIFGPRNLPQLGRRDYVRNSNDPPWLANPHHPLTGYPYVTNDTDDDIGLRPRLGILMTEARLHGTDGYGRRGFSVQLMERMTLNDRNLSAELARDATVAMCASHPSLVASDGSIIDVRPACAALRRWDRHADLNSRGEGLWKEFWLRIVRLSTPIWMTPFDSRDPVNTPRDFNASSPDAERTFADAVEYLNDRGINPRARVRDLQRVDTARGAIPIHGCDPSEGCFNWIGLSNSPTKPVTYHVDDYAHPNFGSSSVQVIGWACRRSKRQSHQTCRGKQGLHTVTRSVLTYGQSTDRRSRYSYDQTILFSGKRWIRPGW